MKYKYTIDDLKGTIPQETIELFERLKKEMVSLSFTNDLETKEKIENSISSTFTWCVGYHNTDCIFLQDYLGNTLLHYAYIARSKAGIELLENRGADDSVANKKGGTPIDIEKRPILKKSSSSFSVENKENRNNKSVNFG